MVFLFLPLCEQNKGNLISNNLEYIGLTIGSFQNHARGFKGFSACYSHDSWWSCLLSVFRFFDRSRKQIQDLVKKPYFNTNPHIVEAYPTVAAVTKAHHIPSRIPRKELCGNSSGFDFWSCEHVVIKTKIKLIEVARRAHWQCDLVRHVYSSFRHREWVIKNYHE